MNTLPHPMEDRFQNFVLSSDYPCLGAKASFNTDMYRFGHYDLLGDKSSAKNLAKDLTMFIDFQKSNNSNFTTFVALFDDSTIDSELSFENKLWQQLEALHIQDNCAWDNAVSKNPEHNEFGFSFGGSAFFIIGLHPNSSRQARRFDQPALVFNAHSQFDKLRKSGKYQKMLKVIRDRDMSFQGTINPMAAEFGTSSEARQYSGREVSEAWKCPFLNQN